MQRCVRCFCVYLNKRGALSKLSAYFTVVLFTAGILNFINTMSAAPGKRTEIRQYAIKEQESGALWSGFGVINRAAGTVSDYNKPIREAYRRLF